MFWDILALGTLCVSIIAFPGFSFRLSEGRVTASGVLFIFYTLFTACALLGSLVFGRELSDSRALVYWISFALLYGASTSFSPDCLVLMKAQSLYGAVVSLSAILSVTAGLTSIGPIRIVRRSLNPLFGFLDSPGVIWNTNYASGMIAIGLIASCFLAAEGTRKARVLYIVASCVSVLGLLIAYSRGILLALGVLSLVYVMKKSLKALVLIAIILCFFFLIVAPTVPSFEMRINDLVKVHKGLNLRDILWASLNEMLIDNPAAYS